VKGAISNNSDDGNRCDISNLREFKAGRKLSYQ
jgi:hypothetical protein